MNKTIIRIQYILRDLLLRHGRGGPDRIDRKYAIRAAMVLSGEPLRIGHLCMFPPKYTLREALHILRGCPVWVIVANSDKSLVWDNEQNCRIPNVPDMLLIAPVPAEWAHVAPNLK